MLSRHLHGGEHRRDELLTGQDLVINPPLRSNFVTAQDGTVTITGQATTDVEMNSATVIEFDIEASNGVVHVVDGVLIPTDLGS